MKVYKKDVPFICVCCDLEAFFGGICGGSGAFCKCQTSGSFHIHCSAVSVWLSNCLEFIPLSSCGFVFVFMILVQIILPVQVVLVRVHPAALLNQDSRELLYSHTGIM